VVTGLYKRGVSIGCAVAFFLGNPTLNLAVLVFMLFTIGWQWAALRLVLGLAFVLGGALIATKLAGSAASVQTAEPALVAGPAPDQRSWPVRWLRSFLRLGVRLLPEYILVIGVLGAARVFLFPAMGPDIGNNLIGIVGLAIAGMLFAIPTGGEIPLIQTMRGAGVGAGPAGALLMTLAPLSLPSLLMLGRTFPTRVLVALGALCTALGIVSGVLAIVLGL
jgi:uncharacterized membrane protein YraQ (UPF0718 family)